MSIDTTESNKDDKEQGLLDQQNDHDAFLIMNETSRAIQIVKTILNYREL